MKRLLIGLAILASAAHAQTVRGSIDYKTQIRNKPITTGTAAPSASVCNESSELNTYYLQTGNPASVVSQMWACEQTGAATYSWFPISHKTGTAAPATCVVGQVFFDTDATAGQNWFGCVATNTWALMSGGGTPTSIPDATPMEGSLLATAIVASGTPAAGKGSVYVDSTSKNLAIKDDAGVVKHGVQTKAPVANNFATGINDAGVVSVAQPTPADLALGTLATAMTVGAGGSVAPTSATVGSVSANQLNGVSLAGLQTGPLANTTTTGIPRAATATDMSIPVACLDAGSTDAYACTLAPVIASYTTGAHYRFKANTANTGAASIAFNSISPVVAIKKVAGGITTDLATNDIRAGQYVDLVYDGTNMQMQSTLGNAPSAGADAVLGNANLVTVGRMTAVSAAGTITELAGITAAAGAITATTVIAALTGNAATATALAANPAACTAGQYVTDIAADGTLTCSAPPAPGVGATVNLTDFEPTVATDTVTIKAGRARIGNYAPVEIAQGTAQFTAGTGNAKIFIDQNNNLVCHMATGITATVTGPLTCSNVATPTFLANSIPIANLTVTSGPMAVALTNDYRAFFSNRGVSAGTGMSITDAGGVATIGVDTASVMLLGGTNAPTGSMDLTGTSALTINAEATGTTLTTVSKTWIPATVCTGTTATLNWDTIATLAPGTACTARTTNTGLIRGLATFSNSEISQMQTAIMLPSDWTGAIDLRFKWQTSATAGSVVWQAATICVADAEVNDVAWNTASTVTDVAKGTTLQANDASIAGLTATGCAAGELLHLKIFRDPAHASDDLAATADLIGVEVTTRRVQ